MALPTATSIGTGSCLDTDTLTLTVTAAVSAGEIVQVVAGGGALHTATADTGARVIDVSDSRGNSYTLATSTLAVLGNQSDNVGAPLDADDLVLGPSGLAVITTPLQVGDTITVTFGTDYPEAFHGLAVAAAITGTSAAAVSQSVWSGDTSISYVAISYPSWVTTPAVVSFRSVELPSWYQDGAGLPDAGAALLSAGICVGGTIGDPLDGTLVDSVAANGLSMGVSFDPLVAANALVDPGWNFDGSEELAVVSYQFAALAGLRAWQRF